MFALLAQRDVFRLWTAHTISILGDYVFFIAITFWIYEQTGSATATGAVLITSTVPLSLFAPLAGMLIDRWHIRWSISKRVKNLSPAEMKVAQDAFVAQMAQQKK